MGRRNGHAEWLPNGSAEGGWVVSGRVAGPRAVAHSGRWSSIRRKARTDSPLSRAVTRSTKSIGAWHAEVPSPNRSRCVEPVWAMGSTASATKDRLITSAGKSILSKAKALISSRRLARIRGWAKRTGSAVERLAEWHAERPAKGLKNQRRVRAPSCRAVSQASSSTAKRRMGRRRTFLLETDSSRCIELRKRSRNGSGARGSGTAPVSLSRVSTKPGPKRLPSS